MGAWVAPDAAGGNNGCLRGTCCLVRVVRGCRRLALVISFFSRFELRPLRKNPLVLGSVVGLRKRSLYDRNHTNQIASNSFELLNSF